MIKIKTEYATFGSFKDLHTFMRLEGINEIKVTTYYCTVKVNVGLLTIDEVWRIITE